MVNFNLIKIIILFFCFTYFRFGKLQSCVKEKSNENYTDIYKKIISDVEKENGLDINNLSIEFDKKQGVSISALMIQNESIRKEIFTDFYKNQKSIDYEKEHSFLFKKDTKRARLVMSSIGMSKNEKYAVTNILFEIVGAGGYRDCIYLYKDSIWKVTYIDHYSKFD